jgi:hypothetical protein
MVVNFLVNKRSSLSPIFTPPFSTFFWTLATTFSTFFEAPPSSVIVVTIVPVCFSSWIAASLLSASI